MNKLIVANWKMNPGTAAEAVRLAKNSDIKGVVIAPPFVFLDSVGRALKKAALGAQNAFLKAEGPWTGEISLDQLKGFKVRYLILGHSERRKLGETDELIGQKVSAALTNGFKVILCVGENWGVRKKSKRAAYHFVERQLVKDLGVISNFKFQISNLLVAYEPVWAIGTGRNDDPADAAEMGGFIKSVLNSKFKIQNSKILYGGSVNGRNARGFLALPEIDGVLVGGASLRPAEFKKMIAAGE